MSALPSNPVLRTSNLVFRTSSLLRTSNFGLRTFPGRINILTVLIAAVLLFALGWFVYDRFLKTEEDRIRDLLGNAAQAARDRSPSGVSAILNDDFRGPEGLDKDMVHGYAVAVLMQQYRKVEVTLLPEPIPVVIDSTEKKNATAQFRVTMRGKADENSSWDELPRRHAKEGGIALKASFKKTDQGWRMNAIELAEDGK